MADYKYGVYGAIDATVVRSALQATETIVYIGAAPINLVRGYAAANIINKPVLIGNMGAAQRTVGYSGDWISFPLAEAISAHFDNALNSIGPIVLLNVLDPDVHRKAAQAQMTLTFVAGKAEIESDKIILDTLALENLAEGTDYTIEYNFTRGVCIIRSAGAMQIAGDIEASFNEVDPALVTNQVVIGDATEDGAYSGIHALTLVHNNLGVIPSVILAPGRSESPEIYRALIDGCVDIGGHWLADVYADIPVSALTGSITQAVTWKTQNGYDSEHSKVFWPQGSKAGKMYHLSVIGAVTRMYVDYTHGGVPYETPANKAIDIDSLYIGAASQVDSYDQAAANSLTQKGITTAIRFGGQWKLWGDHTAAYDFDEADTIDQRAFFDVNESMLKYVINDFQNRFHDQIGSPLDKNRVGSILNAAQEVLDGLKSKGALIGTPQVFFTEDRNTEDEMISGRFYWDITQTNIPPLKAASVFVSYTDAGFSAILAES